MNIRHATPADAAPLAAFAARAFADAFAAMNDPSDIDAYVAGAFTETRLRAELEDPASVFLVAEADGVLAGYAKLHAGTADRCVTGTAPIELVRLYTRVDCIGAGLGSMLMQRCLEEALRRGYRTLWLGVWEHNARALAFYRKWGFEAVGSHEFVLGTDVQNDLLMVREVSAEGRSEQ